MKINTRIFGEIEIAEDKIITFENGIIGFPDLRDLHCSMMKKREIM